MEMISVGPVHNGKSCLSVTEVEALRKHWKAIEADFDSIERELPALEAADEAATWGGFALTRPLDSWVLGFFRVIL